MKPVLQTIRHDPENGQHGNCLQAAIASLLEVPLEKVPHLMREGSGAGWIKLGNWANGAGLEVIHDVASKLPVGAQAIGLAKTPHGRRHAVVVQADESGLVVIFDPGGGNAADLDVQTVVWFGVANFEYFWRWAKQARQ